MKNILVTGFSSGIGEATARLLVDEGYFVYGVYNKNKKRAEELKDELEKVEILQCDFTERDEVISLVSELENNNFSGIVNSAGVFIDINFEDLDMENWDSTFAVNVHAPLLIAHGLKDVLENRSSIVNISSTDGMVGTTAGMAYSASKAALINLTQSLANVFASRDIRVNNIAPGWIGTGMDAPEELLKEAAEFNPLKRNGQYKEIAEVAFFLLSDKSSYINGATITADGGDSATNYILQKEDEIING